MGNKSGNTLLLRKKKNRSLDDVEGNGGKGLFDARAGDTKAIINSEEGAMGGTYNKGFVLIEEASRKKIKGRTYVWTAI